jgi:hypothetical protein
VLVCTPASKLVVNSVVPLANLCLVGQYKLYCKGADTVIYARLAAGQTITEATLEHLQVQLHFIRIHRKLHICAFSQELAAEGLRTLCIGVTTIDPKGLLLCHDLKIS